MHRLALTTVSAFILILTSCGYGDTDQDHRYDSLNGWEKEFADKFMDAYGEPDLAFSCMTVSADTVTVDLSELPEGKYKVQFYTDDPRDLKAPSYLLAEYNDVTGATEAVFCFDYPTAKATTYCAVIANETESCWVSPVTMQTASADKVVISSIHSADLFGPIEPMHYILAFEGKTPEGIDYDYNDIVLDLAYVQGQSSAKITLKAVGCSCYARVTYRPGGAKDIKGSSVIFDEAHSALGYKASYSYAEKRNVYFILNTGINESGRTAEAILDLGAAVGKPVSQIAPNFVATFMSDDEDEKTSVDTYILAEKGTLSPFALLLADPGWIWPSEGLLIHALYPRFSYWITNPTKYHLWYTNVWTKY